MLIASASLVLNIASLIAGIHGISIEYKAKYYNNASLYCNDKVLNLPYTPFKIYWMLPDESVLQPNDVSRREKYIVGRPPNYNLTIQNVNEDDFDRYYCVILWDNSIYLVHSIIVDLEIDGDEFAELYRRNAIIGGICAGVALVVLSLGCLFYYVRYRSVRKGIQKKDEEIKVIQELDKAVKDFEEPSSSDLEPVLQSRDRLHVVRNDVTAKIYTVEINQTDAELQNYDNKAFEIENDGMVPFAESDIDRLPPYTVSDEYPESHYM